MPSLLEQLIDLERAPLSRPYGEREYNLAGFRAWLDSFGRPHDGLAFLHIAGTRGKGSTAAMAESFLRAGGFATATFTSPHLAHYGERFRFDGRDWSEEEFRAALAALDAALGPEQRVSLTVEGEARRTVFEVLTTLALVEFRRHSGDTAGREPQRPHAVIWETGLGGRLDCTNVVDPRVCVISTIGLDHTSLLGKTIEKIAGEKAGIIKAGRPVVLARQRPEYAETVHRVVVEAAALAGAPLVRAWEHNPVLSADPCAEGQWLRIRMPDGEDADALLPLFGAFQHGNVEAAVASVWYFMREEGRTLSREVLAEGLAGVRWHGRLEVRRDAAGRVLVLDGAHCPLGARVVGESLARWEQFPDAPAHGPWQVLWGMQSDKDHGAFLEALLESIAPGQVAAVHCYKVPGMRGAEPAPLAEAARARGLTVTMNNTCVEALAAAKAAGSAILSVGTLYTIHAVGAAFSGGAS